MALTTKERQKNYREKHKANWGKRLDMMVSAETFMQLENLSLHGNKSKKDYLTQLINQEFSRKVSRNEDGFDEFNQKMIAEQMALSDS